MKLATQERERRKLEREVSDGDYQTCLTLIRSNRTLKLTIGGADSDTDTGLCTFSQLDDGNTHILPLHPHKNTTFEERVEMAKLNATLEVETKEDPIFDAINAVCAQISAYVVWECLVRCANITASVYL